MQGGAFTEQHKQKGQVLSALKAGSEDEGVLGCQAGIICLLSCLALYIEEDRSL